MKKKDKKKKQKANRRWFKSVCSIDNSIDLGIQTINWTRRGQESWRNGKIRERKLKQLIDASREISVSNIFENSIDFGYLVNHCTTNPESLDFRSRRDLKYRLHQLIDIYIAWGSVKITKIYPGRDHGNHWNKSVWKKRGVSVELQIGRAHVWTPVTLIYLVCRLLLEKKKKRTKKQQKQ